MACVRALICICASLRPSQASGGLEAFMAKRRKKLAAKDHVHMPHERRGNDE